MKHYKLTHHTYLCSIERENEEKYGQRGYSHCGKQLHNFVFYHKSKFSIVTIYKCLIRFSKVEFLLELVSNTVNDRGKTQSLDEKYIVKSWNDVEDLRNHRLKGIKLQDRIHEVNCLYGNGTHGKNMAIVSSVNFIDKLIDGSKIDKSYEEAKKYINECGLKKELGNELDILYNYNRISDRMGNIELELVKNIDSLIYTINNNKELA